MGKREPEELVEELASSVVMADSGDKPALAQILSSFEELAELVKDAEDSIQVLISDSIAKLRNIIMDDSEDAEGDFGAVSESVSRLQNALREGIKPRSETAQSAVEDVSDVEERFELPSWVDEPTFRDFLSTQKVVIDEIEGDILGIETGETDLAGLKRRIHTMKGEAGVVGLDDLQEVCHKLEDFMESTGDLTEKVDIFLQVKDWIARAVEAYSEFRKFPKDEIWPVLTAGLDSSGETAGEPAVKSEKAEIGSSEKSDEDDSTQSAEASEQEDAEKVKSVSRDDETILMIGDFLQESDEGLNQADLILMQVEADGPDPEKVNGLFRVFHSIKGVAGFLELADISSLAHTTETLLNNVRRGSLELAGTNLDLVFDSVEMMRGMLDKVRNATEQSTSIQPTEELEEHLVRLNAAIEGEEIPEKDEIKAEAGDRLGEVLVASGRVKREDVDSALIDQVGSGKPIGEQLVSKGVVKPKEVAKAIRAQNKAQAQAKIKETVKVDLEKVDDLVEMIGELVIVESMVANLPEIARIVNPAARNYLGQLTKITRDLQIVGMGMRMVPVRGVFQKMARMVRDLSRKGGKKINFVQSGEGTEMDRSMVEQISDPLVHMIRNSVDHGIESVEDRLKAGKSETGVIHLSAYHEGGSIVIEIADDGKGLDREAILAKAIKNQLIKENDNLSEGEIFNLIFAPGFSTAKKVTEISGRGVGMDVVRRNIEAMRGRVIISSKAGKGSTFKLTLPLTLAIIDGMLVSSGDERYIIPTLSIIESIKPDASMLSTYGGKGELINVRGEILQLVRLDRLFNISGAKQEPTDALVVILESYGKKIGLLVDDVLTQQQVVIKSLGEGMQQMKFVSGAAILSDGRVGLILNVEEIGSIIMDGKFGSAKKDPS